MLSPLCGQSRRSGQSHSKPSTRLDKCCKRCHGNLTASRRRSPPAGDRRHRMRRRPHYRDALRRPLRLPRARLFTELSASLPRLPRGPGAIRSGGFIIGGLFSPRPPRLHDGRLLGGPSPAGQDKHAAPPPHRRSCRGGPVNNTSQPRPPHAPYVQGPRPPAPQVPR